VTDLTIIVAILAGLVSFLSPCVLPLIPGFLAYLAGTTTAKADRRGVFLNALAFVLGFSTVFALLGVLLNTVLEAVAYDVTIWLARIGGAIIIFFGFYLLGLIKLPWLEKEHKFAVKKPFGSRLATSFVFGTAFAVGWTPCVGAVLGAILGLAASRPGSAFVLLLSYAIGLGIPFLLVGIFTAQAARLIQRYAKYVTYINKAFGLLLILLGILVFTQQINRLASFELVNRLVL
jgi:cytochrome c-type biogenesis protein